MKLKHRIVFAANGKSALGGLVKATALSHGFDWRDCGPSSDVTNGGIVLIGDRMWLDRMLHERDEQTQRKFVGREDDICYESCYAVDIGCEEFFTGCSSADAYMGESLLDWMLTELYYFNRSEFLFVASEDLAIMQLERFAVQVNEIADELRKISEI